LSHLNPPWRLRNEQASLPAIFKSPPENLLVKGSRFLMQVSPEDAELKAASNAEEARRIGVFQSYIIPKEHIVP
jgi:hypothetical protein